MPDSTPTQPADGTTVTPEGMTATASANILLTPGGRDSVAAGVNASDAQTTLSPTASGTQSSNTAFASVRLSPIGSGLWQTSENAAVTVSLTASGSDSGPQPPNLPDYANAPANVVLNAGGSGAVRTRESAPAPLLIGAAGTAQLTAPSVKPTRFYYTRQYAQTAIKAGGSEQSAFVGNSAVMLAVAPLTSDILQLGNAAAGVSLLLAPAGNSYRSVVDSPAAVLLTLNAAGAARLQTQDTAQAELTALPAPGGVLEAACVASSSLLIACAAYTYLTQHTETAAALAMNAQSSDALALIANTAASAALAGNGNDLLRMRESANVQMRLMCGADTTALVALAQTGATLALSAA